MESFATCPPPPQLWLDRDDGPFQVAELLSSGHINQAEAEQLLQFRDEGYVIFPEAVSAETADAVRNELQHIYLDGDKYLVRLTHWQTGKKRVARVSAPVLPRRSRLLDYYVNSELARDMVLSARISRFLKLLYTEPALAFQALVFTWGTEHEIHTDNAFIVADPPCSIVASWIALEDVDPGCGELAYYPGSHRDPLFMFANEHIAWQPTRGGDAAVRQYVDYLESMARARGEPQYFLARKGDVMLWHANLVHYGTPVRLKDRTRYSMLTHYCPASATPNYFNFFPEASKRPWRSDFYSSRRYDLRPGSSNTYPVYTL